MTQFLINEEFYKAIDITLIAVPMVIIILVIIATLLTSFKHFNILKDKPLVVVKEDNLSNDECEEKDVAMIMASILLKRKYPDKDIIVTAIERIK